MTDQATDIFAETWVLPQDELAVRRKSPPRGQELARRIERLLATDDARKEQPEP